MKLKGKVNNNTFCDVMKQAGYTVSDDKKTSGYVKISKQGMSGSCDVYLTSNWRDGEYCVEFENQNRKIKHLCTLQKKIDEELERSTRRTNRDLEEQAIQKNNFNAMKYLGVQFQDGYTAGAPTCYSSTGRFKFKYVTDAPKCIANVQMSISFDKIYDKGYKVDLTGFKGSETQKGFAFIQKIIAEIEDAVLIGSL